MQNYQMHAVVLVSVTESIKWWALKPQGKAEWFEHHLEHAILINHILLSIGGQTRGGGYGGYSPPKHPFEVAKPIAKTHRY